MGNDFLQGVRFVGRGCGAFYENRKLWKYAALPLSLITLAYLGLSVWLFVWASGLMADWGMGTWPDWLTWLQSLLSFLGSLLLGAALLFVFVMTAGVVFEFLGSFFFDALVQSFIRHHYGRTTVRRSGREMFLFGGESVVFALETVAVFLLLLILGGFFPLAGQILLVVVMGYYYAVSYLMVPGFCDGMSLKETRRRLRAHRAAVFGFGIVSYLLLMIPLAAIFLLPGLVIGAAMFYEERIKPSR